MAKQLEQPDLKPSHEEIAQRAYALFEKSGGVPGHDMEHWLQAEAQLIAAMKAKTQPKVEPRQEARTEPRSNSNGLGRSTARQTVLSHRG